MQLEIRIPKCTHLRTVESFNLNLFADAYGRNQITDLKPGISHTKAKYLNHAYVDYLHKELREVAVEQTTDAVRTIKFYHSITNNAVPASAILPRREYAHRQNAP